MPNEKAPEFTAALEAYQRVLPMSKAGTLCGLHKDTLSAAFTDHDWWKFPEIATSIDKCKRCTVPEMN